MSITSPHVGGRHVHEQPRDRAGRYDFKPGGDPALLDKRADKFPGPYTPPEEMDIDDIATLPPGVPDPLAGPQKFTSIYDDYEGVDDPWSPNGNRYAPAAAAPVPDRPLVDVRNARDVAGAPEYPVSVVTRADGYEDTGWSSCGDINLHNQLVASGVPFRPAINVGHKVDGATYVLDSSGQAWLLMRNQQHQGAFTLDNFRERGVDGTLMPFATRAALVQFLADTPGAGDACRCSGDLCFC